MTEYEQLRAENRRLREALAIFGELAQHFPDNYPDGMCIWGNGPVTIRPKHFRKAQHALLIPAYNWNIAAEEILRRIKELEVPILEEEQCP